MKNIEKRLNQDIWVVLRKIKDHQLCFGEKGKPTTFVYSSSVWDDKKIIEDEILKKLERQGVIKNLKYDTEWNAIDFKVIKPRFDKICSDIEKRINPEDALTRRSVEIHYHPKAGIGVLNGQDFKLRTKLKRKVFAELYENINEELPRYKVLVLIGYYEENEKPNPSNKTMETYKINELIKELRNDTSLTSNQLVNNGGNLTLIGKKVEPE